jgi:hypothetical protein
MEPYATHISSSQTGPRAITRLTTRLGEQRQEYRSTDKPKPHRSTNITGRPAKVVESVWRQHQHKGLPLPSWIWRRRVELLISLTLTLEGLIDVREVALDEFICRQGGGGGCCFLSPCMGYNVVRKLVQTRKPTRGRTRDDSLARGPLSTRNGGGSGGGRRSSNGRRRGRSEGDRGGGSKKGDRSTEGDRGSGKGGGLGG